MFTETLSRLSPQRRKKLASNIEGISHDDLKQPDEALQYSRGSYLCESEPIEKYRARGGTIDETYRENANRLLWAACGSGDVELVRKVLETKKKLVGTITNPFIDKHDNEPYDYDCHFKHSKGHTALHVASMFGHREICRLLIENGWDPHENAEIAESSFVTPADVARDNDFTELGAWLRSFPSVGKHSDPAQNILQSSYDEGLYWAVLQNDFDAVKDALVNNVLLETCVEYPQFKRAVHARASHKFSYTRNWVHPKTGWTALHVCSANENLKLTQILYYNGWSPTIKATGGNKLDALEMSKRVSNLEIYLWMINEMRLDQERRHK